MTDTITPEMVKTRNVMIREAQAKSFRFMNTGVSDLHTPSFMVLIQVTRWLGRKG